MSSIFERFPPPPSARLLGWELIAEYPERGEIEIAFSPDECMLNPHGNVQGGFLAAMLDETMGPALTSASKGKYFASTIEFKVSFLRPASAGRLIGMGRVVKLGRTVAFLEAELLDETGKPVARATSSAMLIESKVP